MSLREKTQGGVRTFHRRYYGELKPLANAIAGLPAANTGAAAHTNKLGDAQRKREARAAKRLAARNQL